MAKYLWIVLAVCGVGVGIYFAGDLLKVAVAGVLTAGFLGGAYYEWKKEKSAED